MRTVSSGEIVIYLSTYGFLDPDEVLVRLEDERVPSTKAHARATSFIYGSPNQTIYVIQLSPVASIADWMKL